MNTTSSLLKKQFKKTYEYGYPSFVFREDITEEEATLFLNQYKTHSSDNSVYLFKLSGCRIASLKLHKFIMTDTFAASVKTLSLIRLKDINERVFKLIGRAVRQNTSLQTFTLDTGFTTSSLWSSGCFSALMDIAQIHTVYLDLLFTELKSLSFFALSSKMPKVICLNSKGLGDFTLYHRHIVSKALRLGTLTLHLVGKTNLSSLQKNYVRGVFLEHFGPVVLHGQYYAVFE